MEFATIIKRRREQLNLGVREAARLTEKTYVPMPIKSAVYISRLENKVIEEMKAEAITIDKLWALGVALQIQPLVLLVESRGMPWMMDQVFSFSVRDCQPQTFMDFIHNRRKELKLTLHDIEEQSRVVSPWSISQGYVSQLEHGEETASKVSAEKLWALGRVLNVDPLMLYVLSRKIENRYLSAQSRDRLFA